MKVIERRRKILVGCNRNISIGVVHLRQPETFGSIHGSGTKAVMNCNKSTPPHPVQRPAQTELEYEWKQPREAGAGAGSPRSSDNLRFMNHRLGEEKWVWHTHTPLQPITPFLHETQEHYTGLQGFLLKNVLYSELVSKVLGFDQDHRISSVVMRRGHQHKQNHPSISTNSDLAKVQMPLGGQKAPENCHQTKK